MQPRLPAALGQHVNARAFQPLLQVDLADSCVLTLSGAWQGQMGWDGWGVPGSSSSSTVRELVDAAVDKVRWWAERCDRMQGGIGPQTRLPSCLAIIAQHLQLVIRAGSSCQTMHVVCISRAGMSSMIIILHCQQPWKGQLQSPPSQSRLSKLSYIDGWVCCMLQLVLCRVSAVGR
jgi:hypothetical protein